jgi:hypothetical protein
MLWNGPPCLSCAKRMDTDECSDFKNPIGRTFLSGCSIFTETGLRRELSRTKVSAVGEAPACLPRPNGVGGELQIFLRASHKWNRRY